jgi:hypothetical protein
MEVALVRSGRCGCGRDLVVEEVDMLMRSAARFQVASIVADGRVEEVCEERGV